jgi:nitric oxide reductase subunit B
MQQDILQTLRWTRTFGDVVFIVGGLGVMWQVVTALFDGKAAQIPAADLAAQRT